MNTERGIQILEKLVQTLRADVEGDPGREGDQQDIHNQQIPVSQPGEHLQSFFHYHNPPIVCRMTLRSDSTVRRLRYARSIDSL